MCSSTCLILPHSTSASSPPSSASPSSAPSSSGLAPALLATNVPIEHALRQNSSQTGSSRSSNRLQRTLVVTEIALSLTLLVACGLLLRTVFALRQVPLGIRTDHIVLVQPSIPAYKYKGTDLNRVLYQPLLDRIRAMHGVEAAALTTVAPLDTNFSMNLNLYMSRLDSEKSTKPTTAGTVNAKMIASTADLKNVFGFRIKQGRYFGPQDTPNSAPVMLVNEAFAKAYESAMGKSPIGNFGMNLSDKRSTKTIGIVEDFRQVGVDQPAAPEMELLASQLQPADSFYQATMQAAYPTRHSHDPANGRLPARSARCPLSRNSRSPQRDHHHHGSGRRRLYWPAASSRASA